MSFLYILPKRFIWSRNGLTRLVMKLKSEVNLCLEMEKALRAMKEENKDLLSKLIAKERERKSA